jgi:hypothetical protein
MKEGVSVDDLDDLLKRVCEVEEKNEEVCDHMTKMKKGGSDGDKAMTIKIKEIE